MKMITNGYKTIAKIECSCCRGDHVLTLLKERDLDLNFTIKQAPMPLFDMIKEYIRMKWRLYTKKNPVDYAWVVLMTKKMVKKLIIVLEKEGYRESTLKSTLDDTHIFGRVNHEADLFELGIVPDIDEVYRYINKEQWTCLSEHEVGILLTFLKTSVKELKDDR
jgi:hypothetical protein